MLSRYSVLEGYSILEFIKIIKKSASESNFALEYIYEMNVVFSKIILRKRGYIRKQGVFMESNLLQKLGDKSITKEQLFQKVKQNKDLIPEILSGISSTKASIRYGCGKILMDLSEEQPEQLYPSMNLFITLLDSKYRILTWNAICIIANLTKVDKEKKFEANFEKYYSFLENDYMVTVANVVGNSGKIALAKPHLTKRIVEKLLMVEHISTTPHLTEECKRVITEHVIRTFDMFFPQIEKKEKVISFVKKHLDSSRKTLRTEAENFLEKWSKTV
jgi:hypothetical protein